MKDHCFLEQLGLAVRERRRELALTAREVATGARLSLRFYGQLEAGQANISVTKLHHVAQFLQTDLPRIFSHVSMRKRPITLLGLRGAGKSTVGPKLAAFRKMPFVELDAQIEAKTCLTLPELFSLHGESYYRRMELECLREAIEPSQPPAVIAVSGGIVHNPEAFAIAKQRSLTICLKAQPQIHMERVVAQGDFRPMHDRNNAMAELTTLINERAPLYAQAEIVVDTSTQSVDDVLEEIERRLPQR